MSDDLIRVENVKKYYEVRKSLFASGRQVIHAVDDVSFAIRKHETLGFAGETGSGKTTVGKMIMRLTLPTSGKIYFENLDIDSASHDEVKRIKRKMSMVFQDPYASLNPRQTVEQIIELPLKVHSIASDGYERIRIIGDLLEKVGLVPYQSFIDRYPHELSGGQKQRVGIARALASEPEFIVADEPVSALDVSVRSQLLNLLQEIKKEFKLTYFLIAHDLAIMRYMCDSLGVMYLGRIMEWGESEKIFKDPKHPYTQALLAAVPIPDPLSHRTRSALNGEIPSQISIPKGCRFHTRCPYRMDICTTKDPELVEIEPGHWVACYLYSEKS